MFISKATAVKPIKLKLKVQNVCLLLTCPVGPYWNICRAASGLRALMFETPSSQHEPEDLPLARVTLTLNWFTRKCELPALEMHKLRRALLPCYLLACFPLSPSVRLLYLLQSPLAFCRLSAHFSSLHKHRNDYIQALLSNNSLTYTTKKKHYR